MCQFDDNVLKRPEAIRRCLSQSGIKSMATIGDSNGGRYYKALVRFMQTAFACNTTRVESLITSGFTPDMDYFKKRSQDFEGDVLFDNRTCRTCFSREDKCWSGVSQNHTRPDMTLEHVAMAGIMDDTIRVDHRKDAVESIQSGLSYQEYILRHYLRGHYPDVFVVFPPFNHVKRETTYVKQRKLEDLKQLLKQYLPPSTKVIWMPAFREFGTTIADPGKDFHFKARPHVCKIIDQSNHVLYDVIRNDLLSTQSRVYSFLDLIQVSAGREEWTTDDVHMKPLWYGRMISYIMELLCQESSSLQRRI